MTVGLPLPHESAALHVTGEALYTDDLVLRLPGVLHAHPVQAPHAHALVTRLDPAPAYDVPGVVRVLTADDVPGVNDAGTKGDEPLFPTEVMFRGHAVCWVLAETLEAARLGAAAVVVEYDELPAIVGVRDAIAAGSFQGARSTVQRGDVETALAGAAHVFSGVTEMAGQEHFYLETHASVALVDEAGQVFVQSSTQHPTETQEIVAHVLGRHSHDVTVQCLRMGGGFGGKEMQPHGYAAVAALGATLTGRPVRVRLTRTQDMTMTGKRHGFHAAWSVGFDDRGRLQALDVTLTSDAGWSLDLSEPVLARALCHVDNAYWIPHVRAHGRLARTNKTSQTAFRGFGGPQGMLVIEDVLGRCAPLLGVDPMELRRRNFYRDGQATPYGQPVRHPERAGLAWDRVVAEGRVRERLAEVEAFNAAHPHTKRGLAVTPVKFGISFNFTAFNQAGALVHVYKDGSVLINHGGTEMGQGLHTKMLQVAATALGVPTERVRLAPTRTDKVPNTSATAASSGADLNGGAVKHACDQILARLEGVPGGTVGGAGADGVPRAHPAVGRRLLPHRGPPLGRRDHEWPPLQVLRVRRGRGRGRGRRVHRRVHDAARRHRPRRRRQPLAAGRPRADRGRLRAGRGLAHARGPALGRRRREAADPGREHVQAPEPQRDAARAQRHAVAEGARGRRRVRLQGRGRATADAGPLGARGAAPGGRRVRPARHQRRAGLPGDAGGGLLGARRGAVAVPGGGVGAVSWVDAVARLRRERVPGVLVTVVAARGHAPRDAGAKLVVSAGTTWGTVGGGNLEETALVRARALLDASAADAGPETLTFSLSDKARTDHGRQCCGGEVTLLLEPLPVVPAVAVFGVGHVGLELARLLSRHDLDLHLVDSRRDQLTDQRLACLADAVASVHVHHAPVPELVLGSVPSGTRVLVMSHDHAEDFAICDAALRCGHLGTIGLIGSAAKWSRFRAGLLVEGHDTDLVDRITCPIGDPSLPGKDPAVVALSIASALVRELAPVRS